MLDYEKWKVYLVVIVCLFGIVFAAPNIMPKRVLDKSPSWWAPVNLGLDLQGGSHLLLEVKYDDVIKEQLLSASSSLKQTFRAKNIRYANFKVNDDNTLTFKLLTPGKSTEVVNIIKDVDKDLVIGQTDTNDEIKLSYGEVAVNTIKARSVDQSIEVVRKRIDELGTKEPSIQRQGDDRIIVQLPGVQNPEIVKGMLGKTAKLSFHLVDNTSVADAKRGKISPSSKIVPGAEGGSYVLERAPVVSGAELVDAKTTFDGASPVVSFKLNSSGAKKFGVATSENVGRRLAIVLDNKVIQAPNINSAITGGSGIISGGFTVESANELSMLLRAGALPARLEVLEERTVGPGLGNDSIAAGKIASLTAVSLVVISIFLMYGKLGTFANIAVLMNAILMLAIQGVLGSTLTLPGIAGIALTMGMSVDGNILIFERMREEAKLGRSVLATVQKGFEGAISGIIDGQLTTLAAGIILLIFGTGPVKGFGVTLTVGIFTSIFTSVMVTRTLLTAWIYYRRPETMTI